MTKRTKAECQFCAGVEPFESPAGEYSPAHFTELPRKGSKKLYRRMAGAWRWKNFTIELLGHVYAAEPPEPPIFNRKWLEWFQRLQHHGHNNQPLQVWTLYNGYRVKHTGGWEMIMHWWPTHDLIFTVKDFKPEKDFDSLTQFLKLFKPETRGEPKFTEIELATAIKKLGANVTQAAVAKELKVSDRTLRDWAASGNMSWEGIRRRYKKTEIW